MNRGRNNEEKTQQRSGRIPTLVMKTKNGESERKDKIREVENALKIYWEINMGKIKMSLNQINEHKLDGSE